MYTTLRDEVGGESWVNKVSQFETEDRDQQSTLGFFDHDHHLSLTWTKLNFNHRGCRSEQPRMNHFCDGALGSFGTGAC